MADVYGFNEAKSKIAVVDKATQDAKDSAQDNEVITSVGMSVDSNTSVLSLNLGKAGGGNVAGSVQLPSAGIEIEEYGEIAAVLTTSVSVTVSESVAISCNKRSFSWLTGLTPTPSPLADGLYYEPDTNKLKRCKTIGNAYNSTGTSTSTYGNIALDDSTSFLSDLETALVGKTVMKYANGTLSDASGQNLELGFKYSSHFILVHVNAQNNVITGVNYYGGCRSSSGNVSISSGTKTFTPIIYQGTLSVVLLDALPSSASIPSDYKKIIDL